MRERGGLADGAYPATGLPAREIRFRNVSFGYPNGRPVLDGFDITIPAGSSLAIVGQNGAGKTTLAKLLCRLYDPQAGAIEIDGVDLRELELGSWRSRVTAVFQDFIRFELPLRDNVAPAGAPDDVIRALRADSLDVAWIRELSPGIDDETVLARAQAENRVLLTFDKDFGELVRHRRRTRGLRLLRGALLIAAAALAVLGLARPQSGFRLVTTTSTGADVVVALDLSRSMMARDAHPNRLGAAVREIHTLLSSLEGSSVGLVGFAGTGRLLSPLSTDYDGLATIVETLGPNDIDLPGSDIGAGLTLAARYLRRPSDRPRAVVLITDGENLSGDPRAGASAVRQAGARLFTIGLGSTQGATIPLVDSTGAVVGERRGPDGAPLGAVAAQGAAHGVECGRGARARRADLEPTAGPGEHGERLRRIRVSRVPVRAAVVRGRAAQLRRACAARREKARAVHPPAAHR
jgi:ABC-type lipoprotein export system ATPase subunit